MTELATIARPYARAAFAMARDASRSWRNGPISSACRGRGAVSDERVKPLIGNPRVPPPQLVDLLL